MARDITYLYNQSNKILSTIISLKNLSDLTFAKKQTFFLFNKIIFLPNQLLVMNLLDLLDIIIK